MSRLSCFASFVLWASLPILFLAGCGVIANDSNNTNTSRTLAVVANSADDSVTVIDADTLSVEYASISLSGTQPIEIVAGNDGLAFVLNSTSNNVSVINVETGAETDVITLSGVAPQAAVLAPDGFLYVAFSGSPLVSKVDVTSTPVVEVSTISTSLASGLAIGATQDGASLYLAGAGSTSLAKIDVATQAETGLVALGMQVISISFHTDGLGYLGTPDSSEVVIVFDPATDSLTSMLPFGPIGTLSANDLAIVDDEIFLAIEGASTSGGLAQLSTSFSPTGFAMDAEDDDSYSVPLPFSFNFLGNTYTQVQINSNGSVDVSDSYVEYDEGLDAVVGFAPNSEDLDSGEGSFAYSSRVFPDHAVFQWVTNCNDDEVSATYVTSFEVVLFADGRARIDYLASGSGAIGEDDGYTYGVGDLSAVVDLRSVLGGASAFTLSRRSFAWDPANPTTLTEVPFEWEGTGLHWTAIDGQTTSVAANRQYVFSTRPTDFDAGSPVTILDVLDRETLLPIVGGVPVGTEPTAVTLVTLD